MAGLSREGETERADLTFKQEKRSEVFGPGLSWTSPQKIIKRKR